MFRGRFVIYVLVFYRLKTPVPPWAGHGPAAQTGALMPRGHSCARPRAIELRTSDCARRRAGCARTGHSRTGHSESPALPHWPHSRTAGTGAHCAQPLADAHVVLLAAALSLSARPLLHSPHAPCPSPAPGRRGERQVDDTNSVAEGAQVNVDPVRALALLRVDLVTRMAQCHAPGALAVRRAHAAGDQARR